MSLEDKERQSRIDLAAAYRLLDHFGWSDLIFTHISARTANNSNTFLINRYGLMPDEITASNLVAIDVDGNKLDGDDDDVNPAGFTIHSAIHTSRHDAVCVIHTHTDAGMAVAAQEEGLLPLNQANMEFYNRVSYYDYEGIPLDLEARNRIVNALGDNNCMILRNHGLLTVGRSIAEAFYYMYYLNKACEIQVAAMQAGRKLIIPDNKDCEFTAKQFEEEPYHSESVDLAWKALLRKLDRHDDSFRK